MGKRHGRFREEKNANHNKSVKCLTLQEVKEYKLQGNILFVSQIGNIF